MKAATHPAGAEPQPTVAPAPLADEARAAEPTKTWTPRVVTPAPAPAEAAEGDLSDLMAENIMLKAKLKVENDRYDALQGVIARELRNLRAHVEAEMQEFEEARRERDRLSASQGELEKEVRDLRARSADEAAQLSEMRSERDLWAARAEALAQPIFQKRNGL
ncbi:hypothetical protein ASG51_18420 [Methylobacterium sp. Leaf465]|nr:hypothetical protein ASF18_08550 [Methylobacterium sp. Leaf89]KQO77875.1 hypothetical protein ASF20_12350 [Methylobacterium sp. Leaf88]KQP62629.1 hypothetical protein ASF41_07935 [Methylobacterium sp. Leaf111]KQT82692.1 hypothetical protein ASG51_18420 [Methylobacterium sp. Leaf465]KQU33315.1 hypothetical protein ASG63_15095 [Methylobacterium sp. Leaf94]